MLKLFAGSARRASIHRIDGAQSGAAAVRLIGSPERLPETAIEQRLMSRLKDTGPISFSSLVNAVAADLYTDELRRGAGVLDIGLLGSRLFTAEVVHELNAGDGVLWEIKRAKDTG